MIKKLERTIETSEMGNICRLFDKVDELVKAVNDMELLVLDLCNDKRQKDLRLDKLESHKHEIDNWNEDYHCPIPTSEPIMQSEELPNHIPADTFYKREEK